MAGVPVAAHWRRWSADAGIGCGVRPGIRWSASSGHPRCRAPATSVPGPGRCQRPVGRWRSSSEPGFGARSRGVGSSLADRRRGEKKIFCCVTTRGRNFRVINGLGRGLGAVTALFLGLGLLGFDADVLTTFGLAASRLPAVDLTQAFRVLAIALVPAPREVLASASFAQADPRARSPRSGQTAVALRTVKGAHGSGNSQGKSSGRMREHSLRALSKLETNAGMPVYRLLENKTVERRQSRRRAGNKTCSEGLPVERSSTREPDRERNGLIDALGTRHRSAALQTIGSAAGSEIGPSERPADFIEDLSV
jgi:hypothetical protein